MHTKYKAQVFLLLLLSSTDVQLLCVIITKFLNAYPQFLYLHHCAPVTKTQFEPQRESTKLMLGAALPRGHRKGKNI